MHSNDETTHDHHKRVLMPTSRPHCGQLCIVSWPHPTSMLMDSVNTPANQNRPPRTALCGCSVMAVNSVWHKRDAPWHAATTKTTVTTIHVQWLGAVGAKDERLGVVGSNVERTSSCRVVQRELWSRGGCCSVHKTRLYCVVLTNTAVVSLQRCAGVAHDRALCSFGVVDRHVEANDETTACCDALDVKLSGCCR